RRKEGNPYAVPQDLTPSPSRAGKGDPVCAVRTTCIHDAPSCRVCTQPEMSRVDRPSRRGRDRRVGPTGTMVRGRPLSMLAMERGGEAGVRPRLRRGMRPGELLDAADELIDVEGLGDQLGEALGLHLRWAPVVG